MAIENALVYEFVTGDNTYPHSGTFTIGVAGQVSIDDSNGVDDATFGDLTHTGGADEPDQDVTASTVSGINATDTIDLRYKYTVTGSDGSSGTIHFIATNGAANYGPYFVSDFPLDPSVTYTFGTFNTDGAAPYASLVPCFTTGTWIETSKGLRVIDNLVEGDLIQTRDNGMQPLRWIGFSNVRATGLNAPIHIAQGALGNSKGLLVSPNHRILITAATADMYFGANEVLVASKLLLGNDGISKRTGGQVTYAHILFDQHEVVVANGTPSESFFPGQEALGTLSQPSRDEVLRLFPELRASVPVKFQKTARMCLNRYEATMLQQLM